MTNIDFLNHKILHKLLFLLKGRFVGGVVRDSLLGIETNDLDMATAYAPNSVFQMLKDNGFNPVATGIEYGTISLFLKDYKIEITSLRKDVKNFGRKAIVEFGGTWEEDSLRRDFTFNGLFLSLEDDRWYIYDYHNGLEDLEKGVVNFIGDYADRIQEDYLRILRFIRFFIRYSKSQDYRASMEKFLPFVEPMKLLSVERILMELESILKTNNWLLGIEMMNNFQISTLFFQTKLLNSINANIIEPTERIIYVLSVVSASIVKNLPMKKQTRNHVLYYQLIRHNFSVDNIYYIWNKTKKLAELNSILQIYVKCSAISVDSGNLSKNLEHKEEDFQKFYKSIPIIHKEGVERGLEEKNIKLRFIKEYILNL